MPNWVIEGILATSPRPGFRPGPEFRVPVEEVESWIAEARDFGIASIICLIGRDQLHLYERSLPHGLLETYRRAGFSVAHIPALDGLTEPYSAQEYDEAWQAFLLLPRPVLVHCSAGMDRTGRVVRHILDRMEGHAGDTAENPAAG